MLSKELLSQKKSNCAISCFCATLEMTAQEVRKRCRHNNCLDLNTKWYQMSIIYEILICNAYVKNMHISVSSIYKYTYYQFNLFNDMLNHILYSIRYYSGFRIIVSKMFNVLSFIIHKTFMKWIIQNQSCIGSWNEPQHVITEDVGTNVISRPLPLVTRPNVNTAAVPIGLGTAAASSYQRICWTLILQYSQAVWVVQIHAENC